MENNLFSQPEEKINGKCGLNPKIGQAGISRTDIDSYSKEDSLVLGNSIHLFTPSAQTMCQCKSRDGLLCFWQKMRGEQTPDRWLDRALATT